MADLKDKGDGGYSISVIIGAGTFIVSLFVAALLVGIWVGGVDAVTKKISETEDRILVWERSNEDKQEATKLVILDAISKVRDEIKILQKNTNHINNFLTRKFPQDYKSIE